MGLRGRALRSRRRAAGLRLVDVAALIPRADGKGPLDIGTLSRIETEQIRLPRGFSAIYLGALRRAEGSGGR